MVFILPLICPYYIFESRYSYHRQITVYSTMEQIVSYELDVGYCRLSEKDSDRNEQSVFQMIYAIIHLIYYLN